MKPTVSKVGRPKKKGDIIPFKFRTDLEEYLRSASKKERKPMIGIMEELLEFRRKFKTFPPTI